MYCIFVGMGHGVSGWYLLILSFYTYMYVVFLYIFILGILIVLLYIVGFNSKHVHL